MSGVDILPTIIAHIFAAVSSGALLNKIGYYIPICLFAAVLISVGSGLISTFSPVTPTGKWIGYQIILRVGRGLGLQMPLIAVQIHYHQPKFPSPGHSSCSANLLVHHCFSVSTKRSSTTVSRLSFPDTHPLLTLKASLVPELLESGQLSPKQSQPAY